jgi:GR25 family glycosyltransferase involved in LPS biosynthesis
LDYKINNSILELSSAICVTQENSSNQLNNLKHFTSKTYSIKDSNISDEYLIKRLLIGIEYYSISNLNLDILNLNKIHVLTLLERKERTDSFINNTNIDMNYQLVYGLKHSVSYVGCAMSYKFIIENAKKNKLPYIIICEDDVLFPNDFKYKLEIILKYLESNKNWDIFVGLMENISNETKLIENIKLGENVELCRVNKFSSMVFNIYNSSVYDKLLNWNSNIRNLENQIDSYLSRLDLNILTIRPFLVSYNTNLNSTIWKNRTNLISENGIQNSNSKLKTL